MRISPVSILLLGLIACERPADEDRRVLVIVSDATFPPFHFLDDDGAPTGLDIELARRVAERAGFTPVVEVRAYDELFSGLAEGRHDLVAATTGITPEREEVYLFTEPYFVTCQAAVVRTGDGEPASLADLARRRVGASGSGTAARAMRSIEGAEHVQLNLEGVGPLLEGDIDALIVDEFDAVAMARESQGTLRVLPEPVALERYAFVLAKGRDDLKLELDRALQAISDTGELDDLLRRFGVVRDADWPIRELLPTQ